MSPRQVLLAALTVLLTSCGYYHEGKQTTPQASFGAQATLGFEVMKVVFERNRCNACHTEAKGNRGGVNLETYANTKPVAAMVLATVKSGDMPMGGPQVSDADIAIIQAWVDAGAPETSSLPLPGGAPVAGPGAPVVVPTPDPVVTPTPVTPGNPDHGGQCQHDDDDDDDDDDHHSTVIAKHGHDDDDDQQCPAPKPEEPKPEEPTTPGTRYDFANLQSAIFQPFCVQCHKGFATYAKVKANLTSIQSAILSDEMPMGGPPLSAELKAMLGTWIADGAPEFLN